MSLNPIVARRTALAAGLAGAGALTLAACSGSNSSSSDQSATSTSGQKLAALADIKIGESAAAKIGSANVLLCRTGQDTAVCFSAVCTHEGCQVRPDGTKLACPCHQSMYDAKTGQVLSGPAPKALPEIAVKVTNGEIVTA
jgi:nitrite reductase/ring-hydroxylating ferredoxin subunit